MLIGNEDEPTEGFEDFEEPAEPVVEPAALDTPATDEPEESSDPKVLVAQLKQERTRRGEAEGDARFWAEKSREAPVVEKAKPVAAPVKFSKDLVEEISSNDPMRVKAAMKEMGFVDQSDVDALVDKKANVIVTESQILSDFPELKNRESVLFRTTARHYNELLKDPDMARSPRLMMVAAKLAKAELGGTKQVESPTERATRVARQAGGTGTRPAVRGTESAASGELNAGQKALVAKFRAHGANITEDDYKKRANAGVRMGGAPTRSGR